jgi:hypothetical protein
MINVSLQRCAFFFLLGVFLLNFAFAEIEVKSTPIRDIMIPELDDPVVFNITLKNTGPADTFNLYTLSGFVIEPTSKFYLTNGESITLSFIAYPRDIAIPTRHYSLKYFIKGKITEVQESEIIFAIVPLRNVFAFSAENFGVDSANIKVTVENKEDVQFEQVGARFTSDFFDVTRTFSIAPKERKIIEIPLSTADTRKLLSGSYTIKAVLETGGEKIPLDTITTFIETSSVGSQEHSSGILIQKQTTIKTNNGNTFVNTAIVLKQNILSRLFTKFTPLPDSVQREGFQVFYTWENGLAPGESMQVVATTNWLFPLLLILIIGGVVGVAYWISLSPLVIRKEVSHVRVKGGEFALRVKIVVQAKTFLDNAIISDRLPHLMHLYEGYAHEPRWNYDEKTKRVQWHFNSLDRGEMKTLTYIVYSKMGVLGKFVLPSASASFEKNGKLHHMQSNRAFFVTEQISKG